MWPLSVLGRVTSSGFQLVCQTLPCSSVQLMYLSPGSRPARLSAMIWRASGASDRASAPGSGMTSTPNPQPHGLSSGQPVYENGV